MVEKILSDKKIIWLLLAILLTFHLGANILWLKRDNTPPAWDQAFHLKEALVFQRLFEGKESWGAAIRSGYGYPPLIYAIGGIWALAGAGIDGISFINTLFFLGSIVGVFCLAGKLGLKRPWALLAAGLWSLVPVIYDISRNFLLDLPLTFFVIWGLYWYLRSDYLCKTQEGWWWFLMLAGASLTKLNGVIYFAPMVMGSVYWAIKEGEDKIWLNLTMWGGAWLLAVGWWWGVNWVNIRSYLTGLAGTGETATDPMNLASIATWGHYLKLLFLHQLGPVTAIGAAVAAAGVPEWLEKEAKERLRIKSDWLMALGFVVANYVIFTIVKNKDFRFTMPILPMVAIAAGAGISQMEARIRKWFIWGLGIWMVFNFVDNSFGWPIKKPVVWATKTFIAGDVEWLGLDDYPVKSAKRKIWPVGKIMMDVVARVGERGRQRLLVLVDNEAINDNNLKLYRDMIVKGDGDKLVEIHSVYETDFDNWKNFDLVLITDGPAAPFYAVNLAALSEAADYVRQNRDKYSQIGEYEMPDGEKIRLLDRL